MQHFDNSSGLPQNSVNAIGSDDQGYIWLATENGLVRYDGQHFQLKSPDKQSPANIRYYLMFTGRKGELLAMNYNDDLVRISNGNVYRDSSISPAERDQAQWYIQTSKRDSGITYHIRLPNRLQTWDSELVSLRLNLSAGGLMRFERDTVTIERKGASAYRHPFRHSGSWNFFLLEDEVFFMEQDGRIVHFGPVMKTSRFTGDIISNPFFASQPGNIKIFWNRLHSGQVLLFLNGTFYLAKRDGSRITTRKICSGFDVKGNTIISALYDQAKGRLYLGSSTLGLFVLTEQHFATRHAPEGFNSHYSLLPLGRDQVLSATGYILSLTQGKALPVAGLMDKASDYYSVCPDGQGGIYNKGSKFIRQFSTPDFREMGVWELPEKVTMLHTDRRYRLWIGIMNEGGIWRMEGIMPSRKPEKLVALGEDATCFAEDGDTMYIGTDKGFYIWHDTRKRLDTLQEMRGRYVRSAKVMAPGEVWITTYGHGFYVYRNGRLSALPPDKDGYLSYAHCIFADQQGYFWIPTNTGLFQARRQDLLDYLSDTTQTPYYHYYDKHDGLATNEFNGGCLPCAVELNNGYTALPSLNGVVFFNTDTVRPVLPAQPVFLDGILLDNKMVQADSVIALPVNFNSLQLQFSSPYMGNRKNLQLRYSLMRAGEEDTVWNILPDDGRVHIPALPSGEYLLTIRKPDGFGLGNASARTLRLRVAAPWYESRWFYFMILFTGIVATMLVVRFRTMYMDRKNAMLKALVEEKTRELQAKSALQEKIMQSVSHNVLTPLKYQHFLSRKIFESVREEKISIMEMARVMNEHTNYLYHMVDNLLKYMKSQMEDRVVLEGEYAPAQTADAVTRIFQDIAGEKGTALTNRIPGTLRLHGDELLLSVILHNLTDNAVKVTRGGHIVLEAQPAAGGTAITVSDTGPGLRTDILQWFNAGEIRDYPGAGGGIGLLIVKELAHTMRVHVAATSEAGKGSVFTIWIAGREQ